jgi:hypothetical protein
MLIISPKWILFIDGLVPASVRCVGAAISGRTKGSITLSASLKKNVAALAAERQRLWDEYNSKNVDDEAVDVPILKKIRALESRIVKAEFKTSAEKLDGLRTLLIGEDADPDEWCDFKASLFRRMMQFV